MSLKGPYIDIGLQRMIIMNHKFENSLRGMIKKNFIQHLEYHNGLILQEVLYVEQYQML